MYDSGMIRIDIEDASGNRKGGGPLATVASLTRTRELDRIGGIKFPVPATDPRTAELQVGRHYKVYHKVLGYLGEFIHRSATVKPGQHPTMEVQANDLLQELVAANCLFNREYSNQYLGTIVTNLLTLVSSWSGGSVANVGYTSTEFQGESVLNAIMNLAQGGNAHFRMGTTARTLDFGTFGAASGVRCVGVDVLGPELEDNDDLAIISGLAITEEGSPVVNRLIPLGAGDGQSQLNLSWATVTDPSYPVQSALNPDGSSYYYIEDVASQTAYGLVIAPYIRSDIRPLSNSDTDLANAANALYQVALAALLRIKDPATTYRLTVSKLRADVLPGETVRVIFRGLATYDGTPYKYVDIDTDMVVLSLKDSFGADGKITHALDVSASGFRPSSDNSVVTQMHRDIQVIKARVQPGMSYNKVGPYERELAPGFNVEVNVRIGDEVLLLNHAKLRFSTKPLRATAKSVASGGGSTQSSESGGGSTETSESGGGGTQTSADAGSFIHTHNVPVNQGNVGAANLRWTGTAFFTVDGTVGGSVPTSSYTRPHHHHNVTIPAHTHNVVIPAHTHNVVIPAHTHGLGYGIYDDSHYPQNIRLYINGVDRTAALGGSWAPTDAAVNVELDITEYLVDAVGGLRQTHEIKFVVTGGTNNQGVIDAQIDMLCTIQAIAVT